MTTNRTIQEELQEKPGFQVWWRMLRPHTLTASFAPVFIGTMIASLETTIHIGLFLAMLIASMLIQAATNMFNEYYDYKKGLDNDQSVGIGGTIVRDGIPPEKVKRLAFVFYGIAALLGLYICIETTFWIAVIGSICMLFGYLYTGGPYPIAYSPFGEFFSGFLMGTVIIGITYYIQTATVTGTLLVLTIPIAILIGAIMLSNNIRDLVGDKKHGRKTMAILVGRENAINILAAFFIVAYASVIVFILMGIMPIWGLIVFLSVFKPYKAIKVFKENDVPIKMMPAMKYTAQTNTLFGLLFGLAFLLDHLPFF